MTYWSDFRMVRCSPADVCPVTGLSDIKHCAGFFRSETRLSDVEHMGP